MFRNRVLLPTVVVLLAYAVIGTSCSSTDKATGSGGGGGGGTPNQVDISGFDFVPVGKSFPAGTTVTWVNQDNTTHTVTSDNGGFTSSGNLGQSQTYQVTFNTPGTFPYHCSIHATMKDTITITP